MKYPDLGICASVLLVALCCISIPTIPAHAQEDLGTLQDLLPPSPGGSARRSVDGQIQLFDNFLVHPMPVWSSFKNGPAPAEQSKIRSANRNGVYTMSMVPKNEDFKAWGSQFSVIALNRPRGPIQQRARRVAEHYKSVCSPSNLKMYKGDESSNRFSFVIACGNYSRQRETGQIAAVVILQNKTGAVTLSRQWQDTAFQAGLPTTWPVEKSEIENVLRELVRSKLLPIRKN
jgi:hypothetical protein